jgi:hypothetical protein
MNSEWAERKLSCPAANYCSKHLLERPKIKMGVKNVVTRANTFHIWVVFRKDQNVSEK